MTPEIQEKLAMLEREIEDLKRWKNDKRTQQLPLPLDVASLRSLDEAFTNNTFGTIRIGNIWIYSGAGAPSLRAGQGSLYLNTTGSSSSTRAYINSDGATSWVAITTAS